MICGIRVLDTSILSILLHTEEIQTPSDLSAWNTLYLNGNIRFRVTQAPFNSEASPCQGLDTPCTKASCGVLQFYSLNFLLVIKTKGLLPSAVPVHAVKLQVPRTRYPLFGYNHFWGKKINQTKSKPFHHKFSKIQNY